MVPLVGARLPPALLVVAGGRADTTLAAAMAAAAAVVMARVARVTVAATRARDSGQQTEHGARRHATASRWKIGSAGARTDCSELENLIHQRQSDNNKYCFEVENPYAPSPARPHPFRKSWLALTVPGAYSVL